MGFSMVIEWSTKLVAFPNLRIFMEYKREELYNWSSFRAKFFSWKHQKVIMECSICWNRLEGNLVTPGCNHLFHLDCMQRWITERERTFGPRVPITCPYCRGGDCRNYVAVPYQGQWMPTNTRRCLTCEVCGRVLNSTAAKTQHLRTHNGRVSCNICNATFAYQEGLTRHQAKQHQP